MSDFILDGNTTIENQIDILFSCVSFEDRCTAITKYIPTHGKLSKVFVYRNKDACFGKTGEDIACRSKIESNREVISEHLKAVGIEFKEYEGAHREIKPKITAFRQMIDDAIAAISSLSEPSIGIDVTCFARVDIIILLDYICTFIPIPSIKIIYIRPKDHATDWLSRGYSGIDSILGFGGEYDYLKDDLLVVLSGFEDERPQNFMDAYESEITLFGTSAKHPTKLEFGERTEELKNLILNNNHRIKVFDFSAESIANCYSDLENVLKEYISKYNIVIAPLSTKLSVVATFLYAKKHPQIQLSYCYPQEYNWEKYSTGMDKIYIEDVAIGDWCAIN